MVIWTGFVPGGSGARGGVSSVGGMSAGSGAGFGSSMYCPRKTKADVMELENTDIQ
jgi:hypothetical protein